MAAVVAIGTLIVVASIVFQVVNGKHSVDLARITETGATTVVGTLFKS